MKEWYYNEYKQTGLNFENEDEVKQYDKKFKSSRDIDHEFVYITKSVDLNENSIVLEIDLKVARDKVGERLAQEIIINIRDEFPTYDWIIEGLLKECQFPKIKKITLSNIMSVFICSK